MKLKFTLFVLFFITIKSFSQEKTKVLFTIDKEPVYTKEFVRAYTKNRSLIDDSKKIDSICNLLIDSEIFF